MIRINLEKKANNGITLIALVITIIVLLILVGVTIATLMGDNGLLEKAQQAKEENEEASDRELIAMAVLEAQKGKNGYQDLNSNSLQEAIDNQFQGRNIVVSDNGDDTFTVSCLDTLKDYKVTSNGIEDGVDWNEAMVNAVAPESQDEARNEGVIAIGTDGRTVDMDLWAYSYDTLTGGYCLNSEDVLDNEENGGDNSTKVNKAGYLGQIKEGKIIGSVPMYIKKGNDGWIAVTSLYKTFQANVENNSDMADLIYPPTIPNTVKNLMTTFAYSNIRSMPQIPSRVTNMVSSFYSCSKLIEAFNIPGSVQTMDYCFNECTLLESTPEISYGVISMNSTFSGCSRLISVKTLPDSIKYMEATFRNCILLENMTNLPQNVENLDSTFEGCSLLKNGPLVIPNSVISMICTFMNCSNLQGSMEINANIEKDATFDGTHTYYYMCFAGATTKNDIKLIIRGNCKAINEIIATKNSNSNIELGL